MKSEQDKTYKINLTGEETETLKGALINNSNELDKIGKNWSKKQSSKVIALFVKICDFMRKREKPAILPHNMNYTNNFV